MTEPQGGDTTPRKVSSVGPILIGLAYLALVVFIIVFCATQSKSFDEYSKYWGLFATLVGVATGAIPSYFFKTQADQANSIANKASDLADQQSARADRESTKAQLFAQAVDPDRGEAIRTAHADLFQ